MGFFLFALYAHERIPTFTETSRIQYIYKDETLNARRYIRKRALMILRIRIADE